MRYPSLKIAFLTAKTRGGPGAKSVLKNRFLSGPTNYFLVVLRNAATVAIGRSADSRFHWKQHMVAWHGVVRRGRCCGNIRQMSAKGRSMLVRLWMSA